MCENLKIWQESMELVEEVYKITFNFFQRLKNLIWFLRLTGLTVSIPSNIAEGKGRSSDKEFIAVFYILQEVHYLSLELS